MVSKQKKQENGKVFLLTVAIAAVVKADLNYIVALGRDACRARSGSGSVG